MTAATIAGWMPRLTRLRGRSNGNRRQLAGCSGIVGHENGSEILGSDSRSFVSAFPEEIVLG